MDATPLRAAGPADMDAIAELMALVFHDRLTDERRALVLLNTVVERSVVADDAGAIVGHTTAQTRELTVPGSVVPAAHVTGVGVAPTHRRRGLLKAMMHRQLTEIAEARREPVAVLWASETSIYPRFGYGPASTHLRLDAMTREVRFTGPAEPAGRLRLVQPAAARAELAAIHDRARTGRPGRSSRPDRIWQSLLTETDAARGGATDLRGVICEGPAVGYALWRVEDRWDAYGPNARVRVAEVVAEDPAVYATLWRFLFGIDLARSLTYDFAAVDEPLQYLVDEPRRLGCTFTNGLWVRLTDLPAALEARRYQTPVDVVFEVDDPVLPGNAGRWRLTGGPDKATCVRTDETPDFACGVTELGAAYLGGTSLTALAAAGRIRQLTGNLPSTAFGSARAPAPVEVF
jgi:predicted acetyltransferase